MSALTPSAELVALMQRKREARPWVDQAAQDYVLKFSLPKFDAYRHKSRRRRPSKRVRAALKNRSAQ